jgi:hypothetical protein
MEVIPISKKTAEAFVVQKHYSHRASIFWKAFGLVIDGMIEGVCVFGQPSPPIQRSAFKDRDFKLYELARLVVQTGQKNAASFLIGRSLAMLEGPCAVVSYADSEYGHVGIVYQATNWLYTGATISHDVIYVVDGKRVQPITLRDRLGITRPKKWAMENNIETIKPKAKHRYFQFVGDKRQRRDMLAKLQYPVIPIYPKGDKQTYDSGPNILIKAQTQPEGNKDLKQAEMF